MTTALDVSKQPDQPIDDPDVAATHREAAPAVAGANAQDAIKNLEYLKNHGYWYCIVPALPPANYLGVVSKALKKRYPGVAIACFEFGDCTWCVLYARQRQLNFASGDELAYLRDCANMIHGVSAATTGPAPRNPQDPKSIKRVLATLMTALKGTPAKSHAVALEGGTAIGQPQTKPATPKEDPTWVEGRLLGVSIPDSAIWVALNRRTTKICVRRGGINPELIANALRLLLPHSIGVEIERDEAGYFVDGEKFLAAIEAAHDPAEESSAAK
jgi:hypothetical protein